MPIINQFIELETETGINIDDLTPKIEAIIANTSVKNGQVIVFNHQKRIEKI
jgi:thiamine phosphate synthase YjbQ (UPF0047 family)